MRKSLAASIAFLLCLLAWPAWAQPAIDGTARASVTTGGTTVQNATGFTSTQANDVIFACVEGGTTVVSGTPITYTVAGGGLTWTKRTRQSAVVVAHSSNYPLDVELWWAPASSTVSGITVTATADRTQDDAGIVVFAASGVANINAPWDTNVGLPSVASYTTSGTGTVQGTISTTQTKDLIIACFGSNAQGNTGSYLLGVGGTGQTDLAGQATSAGTNWGAVTTQYKQVTVAQSGASISTATGAQGWFFILDAVTATATSTASPAVFRSFP